MRSSSTRPTWSCTHAVRRWHAGSLQRTPQAPLTQAHKTSQHNRR